MYGLRYYPSLFKYLATFCSLILTCNLTFADSNPLRLPGPHSERIHLTTISATLDTELHKVDAKMQLQWTNLTGQALTEIPFHLYLNAFSSTDTPFMIESDGGQLREDERDNDSQKSFSYVIVTKLTGQNGEDLLPNWQMNQDVANLVLPNVLQPNETLILSFEFQSQLPKVFARSGHDGKTFNFIAQWFPKPGVWFAGEWNNHRYHAHSEYFADFGNYDVSLTVPSEFVVGATGALQAKTINNELTTHRFLAKDVHDFVWVADSNFGEALSHWNGVDIKLLYQKPLDQESIQAQLDATAASFKWFDQHVGAYPYSTMTLVQPSEESSGAAGMEYPTLVTTITDIEKSSINEIAALVTVHEIGHNYWQGILASNEFEESWMDEGINSYTEGRIMRESLQIEHVINAGRFKISMDTIHRIGAAMSKNIDPVKTKSWEYIDGASYGTNSYSKPATILNTAERIWGVQKMDTLLSSYYQQWSFKHPTTEDFLEVAKSVDSEMADFLKRAITTTQGIDLLVHDLESKLSEEWGGFDLSSEEFPPPFTEPVEAESYLNKVSLRRQGELFPKGIAVRLRYANGEIETKEWLMSNDVQWENWRWSSDSQLVEVIIDPEYKLLLDSNFANNIRRTEEQSNDSWRWTIMLTQILQNVSSTLMPL